MVVNSDVYLLGAFPLSVRNVFTPSNTSNCQDPNDSEGGLDSTVGPALGCILGFIDIDGSKLGCLLGNVLGRNDGTKLGIEDGKVLGAYSVEGTELGMNEGTLLGTLLGTGEGSLVRYWIKFLRFIILADDALLSIVAIVTSIAILSYKRRYAANGSMAHCRHTMTPLAMDSLFHNGIVGEF